MRMLQELPDGYCEAAMTYASEDWMARQVLGFGSAVRVLGPDSLAARVRRRCRGGAGGLPGCGAARLIEPRLR